MFSKCQPFGVGLCVTSSVSEATFSLVFAVRVNPTFVPQIRSDSQTTGAHRWFRGKGLRRLEPRMADPPAIITLLVAGDADAVLPSVAETARLQKLLPGSLDLGFQASAVARYFRQM